MRFDNLLESIYKQMELDFNKPAQVKPNPVKLKPIVYALSNQFLKSNNPKQKIALLFKIKDSLPELRSDTIHNMGLNRLVSIALERRFLHQY